MPQLEKQRKRRTRRQQTECKVPPRGKQDDRTTSRIGGLLRVLGIPGLFLSLLLATQPNVDIGVRDPIEATLPLSVSFPVTNNGRFDVYDIYSACLILHASTAGGLEMHDALSTHRPLPGFGLGPGQTTPVVCGIETMGSPAKQIDIVVGVMLRAKFRPGRFFSCSRFALQPRTSEHPRILEHPIVEGCERLFAEFLPPPLPTRALFSPTLSFW